MIRWMPNVQPIPMWTKFMNHSGNVDRWQVTEAEIPCHCTVDAGFAPAGTVTLKDPRDNAPRIRVLLSATPESETSCFLFYAQIRNFGVEDAALTERFKRDSRVVFDEDVTIMEAQQRMISAMPRAPMIDLRSDAPHLAMRKLVGELIEAEQAGGA